MQQGNDRAGISLPELYRRVDRNSGGNC